MQCKLYFLWSAITVFISLNGKAQYAAFLTQGNISFEKRVNTLALIQERFSKDDDVWEQQIIDAYKKAGIQFKTAHFNLAFKDEKTLYTPIADDAQQNTPSDFTSVANQNIVYSNLDKQQSIAFKTVFDDKFLIKDSTRKIHWKITDELRDIAGFRCRRANAIIMDSIYVVAFFTTEILTTGGPESFNGLPGMILGVALPHEHVTWFATKVSASQPVTDADLMPPAKGKPVNKKEYYDKLRESLKDWGKTGGMIMQNAML